MSMSMWQEKSLFSPVKQASIAVPETHELVKLAEIVDWISLIRIARKCREQSRKRLTGLEPRYRQLLGALVLMATRGCNYRDAEDSYYAPARFLCDNGLRNWFRPRYNFRLHSNAWPRRNGVDQQINTSTCSGWRALRSKQDDERYNRSRGQDSLSDGGWADESIYVDSEPYCWQITRKIRRPQRRRTRSLGKSAWTPAELSFVCKRPRAEKQNRTQNVSHCQRDSEKDCNRHKIGSISKRSDGTRTGSGQSSHGKFAPSNQALFRHWFRGSKKSNSSAYAGIIFDSERQGRKDRRIWDKVGYEWPVVLFKVLPCRTANTLRTQHFANNL